MLLHKHAENVIFSSLTNILLDKKIAKTESILENKGSKNATLHLNFSKNKNKFNLKIILECHDLFNKPIILQHHKHLLNSLILISFKELIKKINEQCHNTFHGSHASSKNKNKEGY